MESYIPVSYLNDFVYSPESIYLHGVYQDFDTSLVHEHYQTRGLINHSAIDNQRYSSQKHILQGTMFFCQQYSLCGRIDIFNTKTGELTERKSRITTIYPGYKYQLYAQMFGLEEIGYNVQKLSLYSFQTNQKTSIPKPVGQELQNFEELITRITQFDPLSLLQSPHSSDKTMQSIYRELSF